MPVQYLLQSGLIELTMVSEIHLLSSNEYLLKKRGTTIVYMVKLPSFV